MSGDIKLICFPQASCIVDSVFFDNFIDSGDEFAEIRCIYDSRVLQSHRFSDKRKRDFLAGRYCGMNAIRLLLGDDKYADIIDINEDRTPNWPCGIVGSITHTRGLAGAAVGISRDFFGIGMDYESVLSVSKAKDLSGAILNKRETMRFLSFNYLDFNVLCTLIFSAKESIFKCVYPLVHRYFGMDEIEIYEIDVLTKCFKFRFLHKLRETMSCSEGIGFFCVDDMYVYTLVEMKKHK